VSEGGSGGQATHTNSAFPAGRGRPVLEAKQPALEQQQRCGGAHRAGGCNHLQGLELGDGLGDASILLLRRLGALAPQVAAGGPAHPAGGVLLKLAGHGVAELLGSGHRGRCARGVPRQHKALGRGEAPRELQGGWVGAGGNEWGQASYSATSQRGAAQGVARLTKVDVRRWAQAGLALGAAPGPRTEPCPHNRRRPRPTCVSGGNSLFCWMVS
jgi:hypothetical protein